MQSHTSGIALYSEPRHDCSSLRMATLVGGKHKPVSDGTPRRAWRVQVDVVMAITDALNRKGARGSCLENPPSRYVNMLIVPEGSTMQVDTPALKELGIQSVQYVGSHRDDKGRSFFNADRLVECFHTTFADLASTTSSLPQ